MFTENNYCNIFNAWRKNKKDIYSVRDYFNLPKCSKNKCISYQKYICDSMCEMRVYNFLYLRNIKIYKHQNYEGDLSAYIDDVDFIVKRNKSGLLLKFLEIKGKL